MEEEVTDTAPTEVDTAPVEVTETATQQEAPKVEPEVKEFAIPDDYKDKGWTSKIKSEDDLYKLIDNLDGIVGKKVRPKQPDWEDEQSRNEFLNAMRPENKEDYAIPEAFAENEANLYKDLLFENGVTAKQAENIFSKLSEVRASAFDADDMVNQLKDSWGGDVEANTNKVMSYLRESVGKEDQALIDGMPNNVTAMVYRVVNGMLDSHGVTDTDKAIAKTGAPAQVDKGAERSRLLKEINTENSKGAPDYAKLGNLKNDLNKLYQ